MRPDYVDFHTHLDLYPDLAQAIATCDRLRVATLAVTTTPKAFERNVELSADSDFVRVGLGLHPQLVADRHLEIDLFESLLPRTRYVGEVGLDRGPAHYRSFELQRLIFERILRACAEQGNKILSLHSVRATKPILDMLDEHLPPDRAGVVLHWFTGSKAAVRRAVDRGCYFSVNEGMLASASGVRVIREIPIDRVLTETDGPFLTRDDKPIKPGDVGRAVEMIASCAGSPVEVVRAKILSNLKRLLQSD
ncbi:Qat anti-phage system TatD family nuclease QatD [Salinisphaera sp. LB1]|uniref:Qat anti-phage system TatD family nuclease QatD n=1 Tax=Salinisphaera sp. LB1 TaxID=2183911 RepID=UPI000D7060D3|nr:Qat anti-phage system TatD family nuclease QatD [Salinisphaera sp. LB1]AWN17949.1 Putative deoxyribonuclease similar to YcfH, type 4 [Salinisphaera sp. LB1]